MTVAQLIKHLQRFPSDADVMYLIVTESHWGSGMLAEPVTVMASRRRSGREQVVLGASSEDLEKLP